MNKPLISYVLTAYNLENYIRQSIECAFAQTYSPLQIVLSDDCSTDRTFDIMKEMAEAYQGPHSIKLNRNSRNLGITQHMNKAYLELADGEIIVAAHGDDLSVPDRTSVCYDYLSQHPACTAVSGGMQAVMHQEDGSIIPAPGHSAVVRKIHTYRFDSCANIPAPSRCFYKRVMEEFGPLHPSCPTEDELISFRALMLGENAFLPEVLVTYRKHAGSNSNISNFAKFPLNKIVEQQLRDMLFALGKGWISDDQLMGMTKALIEYKEKRERYRRYLSQPTWINLFYYVFSGKMSIRHGVKMVLNKMLSLGGKTI